MRQGPFGRFLAVIYRLPVVEREDVVASVQRAVARDLTLLAPLLASPMDHAARLNVGDICLWTEDEEGPTGLVWLNRSLFMDVHFGQWSCPSSECGYLNQLVVSPRCRGRGLAPLLVRAAQHYGYVEGLSSVRAIVIHQNHASRRVFEKCGAHGEGWLFGIRLGRFGTLRFPFPMLGYKRGASVEW